MSGRWIPLAGGAILPADGAGQAASTDLPIGLAPGQVFDATRPSSPRRRAYLLLLDVVTPDGGSLVASGADPTVVRVTVTAVATRSASRGRRRHRRRPRPAPSASERGLEPVDERDLGGLEPAPRLVRIEPADPVDLREHLAPARSRRPLHLERVRQRRRRVQVALDRPGVDDLAALLDDRAERDGRGRRVDRRAGLLRELAPSDPSVGSAPSGSPFGIVQSPRSRLGEIRPARVGEEHLEPPGRRHAGTAGCPRSFGQPSWNDGRARTATRVAPPRHAALRGRPRRPCSPAT